MVDRLRGLKWEGWVAFGAGLFAMLVGLLVLLGWHTHNTHLIQLSPHLIAMQYNTALALLCSGLALASVSLGWQVASQCLTVFGGGIAFLTFIQYLFGINLGIDQFFHTYNLPNPMTHPGRMAFNTSTAISSTNIAIFLLSYRKTFALSIASSILSILVTSIAITSIVGHLTGLEAIYGFLDFARMAVHISLLLLVLGFSIFIYSIRSTWDAGINRFALPGIAVIGMLAATLFIWQMFRTQGLFALQHLGENQAKHLQGTFNEKLQNELNTIEWMVDRWEALEGFTPRLWTVDSHNYIHDMTDLDELAIYNRELKLQERTLQGAYGSLPPIDTLLPNQISQIKSGTVVIIPSPRKEFLLVYYPLMSKDEFKGILAASIDLVASLKADIASEYLGNYLISLFYDNQLLFSGGNLSSRVIGIPVRNGVASQFGSWQIEMTVTESVSLSGFESLDLLILATGLIITALGGTVVFIGQNIRLQKKELEKVNNLFVEASQRADAASVAKGIFLATMSHEIRTPLNAIVGTIELLAESEISSLQKKYLDRIIQSSKVLLELIGDILDFSKIEAGGIALNLIPGDLLRILKTVADNLALKTKEKKIDIFVECPSQPLPELLFDPIRLQQILSNLGNNSYKFTDSGYLFLRLIVKISLPTHLIIRFEVVDTGIGISPEDQTKLFQKFSQVEKSQSRKYGGAGLGLSICKKLTELMKGEIGVISQAGQGSTFWVEIPFEISAKTSPPLYSIVNKSILLLDEKEKERAILQRYLTDWGAKVSLDKNEEKIDWILSSTLDPNRKNKTLLIAEPGSAIEGAAAIVNRPIFPSELYKCFEGKW